jgi:membrane-associated phospholipid phosphatase
MVLGVHYLQDVLGGIALGLAALAVFIVAERPLSRWLARQTLWIQIGLVVLVSALLLVLHPGLIPPSTPEWIGEPLSTEALLEGMITIVAAFLGMGIGFALEERYVRFDAGGIWWKRLLRFLVGIAGVMALRYGLKYLFGEAEPVSVFRLLRYTVVGLWAGFGAPWVFLKTGLSGLRASRSNAE